MTLLEYQRRLENIQTSDAPTEVKDEAIRKLREQFEPVSASQQVLKDIQESQADYDDLVD